MSNLKYLLIFLGILSFGSPKIQSQSIVSKDFYNIRVHKLGLGMIRQDKNYFYAEYIFWKCNMDGHINFLPGKSLMVHGPLVAAEVDFAKKTVFTPKIGYSFTAKCFLLQAYTGVHTDFKTVSGFVSPQIGISLVGIVDIFYGHEFSIGGKSDIRFRNKFGITIALPYGSNIFDGFVL